MQYISADRVLNPVWPIDYSLATLSLATQLIFERLSPLSNSPNATLRYKHYKRRNH